MLCDSHIHFIPPDLAKASNFYKGVWSDKQRLYDYLSTYKIEKALLVCSPLDINSKEFFTSYNNEINKISKENQKIIPAGLIDLDKNISSQLKQLKDLGFKVISIFSSFQGRFILEDLLSCFESIEGYGFYIFVHPQINNPIGFERIKDPLLTPVLEYSFDLSMFMGLILVERIPVRFNIKFIFASLGGVIPFLKDRFDRIYTMLRERNMVSDLGALPSEIFKKNIYIETSASPAGLIKLAMEVFGEDKIIFGSDYPASSKIDTYLEDLKSLGKDLKEKIRYKNFISLFNE
ncbi:MAG: amidohydrolase [Candidatus Omnitrophica bacterium]|nr:amidohydrolase [Candidatus Omnitrophota bacterium]